MESIKSRGFFLFLSLSFTMSVQKSQGNWNNQDHSRSFEKRGASWLIGIVLGIGIVSIGIGYGIGIGVV